MWKCHKCGKPVYFAERKQSLGYDWHPECLRCEECGKRLNPGQHAEHKGVPYCHVPCYGALFGPQLFGHGTRVESHKSFGQKTPTRTRQQAAASGPPQPRDHLESKLKVYNQFFDNKSLEIRSREVNGRLVLEGALRVYWGVQAVIHLKEDDDQRPVVTVRKRNSCRYTNGSSTTQDISDKEPYHDLADTTISSNLSSALDDTTYEMSMSDSVTFETCSLSEDIEAAPPLLGSPIVTPSSSKESSPSSHKSVTLPSRLLAKDVQGWDEIDELLQVERPIDAGERLFRTMPSPLPSQSSVTTDAASIATDIDTDETDDSATLRPGDFDDFRKQVKADYLNGTNEMGHTSDGTLKLNQPIDPSRINDSLKLYSENMMSKSYTCGETPNMSLSFFKDIETGLLDPLKINDTFNLFRHMADGDENSPDGGGYALQKSGSTSSRPYIDIDTWQDNGLNRSKSGPNCCAVNNVFGDSDIETLRPSTIRRATKNLTDCGGGDSANSISIEMNCYPVTDNAAMISSSDFDDDSSDTTYITVDGAYMSEDGVMLRKPPKTGSTAIKRRSGNRRSRTKLKRRCSINGHFYNRETSFFKPPYGSQMSVWITSLVNSQEIINLLLEKYKVDNTADHFALFIVRDNGEQRRLKEDDYPLLVRVMLGPHEDVARLFLMDAQETPEISCEVAQFLNLSILECRAILERYSEEQDREERRIKEKYSEMRLRIMQRMDSLKVRL